MSQEFEIKRLSLEEQRDRLQQQLDNLKEELTAKLNMANQEVQNANSTCSESWIACDDNDDDVITLCGSPQVSHLQELVREGEQNLGSAQTQITCLRETQEKLKIELDATRSRVRETSNLLTDLQVRTKPRGFCMLYTVSQVWSGPRQVSHLFGIICNTQVEPRMSLIIKCYRWSQVLLVLLSYPAPIVNVFLFYLCGATASKLQSAFVVTRPGQEVKGQRAEVRLVQGQTITDRNLKLKLVLDKQLLL